MIIPGAAASSSLASSGVMVSSIPSSEKDYDVRTLTSKITLNPYKNSMTYNFDIVYAFCEFANINNFFNFIN